MCGIAGWSLDGGDVRELSELGAMSAAIAHRGPDDQGTFADAAAGIALDFRRLRIIDLSEGGHQPMASADGSVVLIFNGELYNYLELKRELESLGRVFKSRSDAEVVLVALAHWGAPALARFDGMFALAAWYVRERKLLLARDPMGMKPLYYAAIKGGVAFASEIKAFLGLEGFRAEMNPRSLRQYLEFGYVFDAQDTSLAGVSKLPPGHAMEIAAGRAGAPYAFFTPRLAQPGGARTLEQAADELHATLGEVVRQHLVADVPVGLLLSGGLDSSIVAALAAQHARVATISMGFADSAVDERAFARAVAQHIGSDHREVLIGQREITEGLEEVVWYFDDLFADWGTVSTRLLYAKCRAQGIKVVLVGEGSDELFGGYGTFGAAQRGRGRGPVLWQLFQLYRRYAGRRYGGQFGAFASTMRGYLAQSHGSMFDAVRLFETRNQLPNNYVMKVDKASMSVSVEARAPYLDRRVAALAYSIPEKHLLADGTDKLVLRTMAERHRLLPPEITRRTKFGASIAASWMDESQEFRNYARDAILAREGWTDRLGLRGAMTDFFDGTRKGYAFPRAISIFSNLAWRLLLLQLWSRKYLTANA